MSREAARILLDVALRCGAEQDAALAKAQEVCSQEEFSNYRLAIGRTMAAILHELINPIVAKYPDLKPPELE
jgi:hypothetical protein